MKTYISSDYHFSHKNIIKYCDRPFETVEEMNATIIKNHNEVVKPEDTFIHNGDFAFGDAEYYIKQLNGNKTFIKGNHDRAGSFKPSIESLVLNFAGYRIKVVHNPLYAEERYPINLTGHVHNLYKIKRLSKDSIIINIGTDVWNFKPVSLDEIIGFYKKWIKNENKTI